MKYEFYDMKKAAEHLIYLEKVLDATTDEMIDEWVGVVVSEETAGRLKSEIDELRNT